MLLDFTKSGVLKVDTTNYAKDIITEFDNKLNKSNHPWNEKLFQSDEREVNLNSEKSKFSIRS